MKVIVTGGAGFIGSALVRYLIRHSEDSVVNVDKLTYAGNLETLRSVADAPRYQFEQVAICDADAMRAILERHRPQAVMHLAAESHVDRSIDGPSAFIDTNIMGTYVLLEESLRYWRSLDATDRDQFRFLHVSTDEVYGSLGQTGLFSEDTAYHPNSPYAASKAASDHLVSAWYHTYGLPVLISNCSNNYGPYQYPEKLIPLAIYRAIHGQEIPIYGRGDNVRDWLYVDDHVRALQRVLECGRIGESYNVGAHNEKTNLQVIETLCAILDELLSESPYRPHRNLISFVADRPGHDQRYAIDARKITSELHWRAQETFESGLRRTVQWYLEHRQWCESVLGKSYGGERLGLKRA